MADRMSVSSTSMPGLLAGRYEVGQLLGTGGMAEVFAGRDRMLAREIAIKVPLAASAGDPSFLARFRREAQAAASLAHPNAVAVYDTGVERTGTGDLPYIVMERVVGCTLREVVRAEAPLPPTRAAKIAADVCGALTAAHRRGLIHRDIKPGNIMLTPDGRVKVVDFGIAQAAAASTTRTAVVGTARYIAPEQAEGRAVDARSDLYALGCCLYELLTGQPPFSGPTPVAVASRHVHERPRPLRELAPDVPAYLEAMVMKAMAKRPEDRHRTAAELRADLERAWAGLGARTRIPPGETAGEIAAATCAAGAPVATLPVPMPPVAGSPVAAPPAAAPHSAAAPVARLAKTHSAGAPAGAAARGARVERSGRRGGWAAALAALLLVTGAAAFLLARSGRPPPAPPPRMGAVAAPPAAAPPAAGGMPAAAPSAGGALAAATGLDAGGPPADGLATVRVPDVVGLRAERAGATLRAAGMRVRWTRSWSATRGWSGACSTSARPATSRCRPVRRRGSSSASRAPAVSETGGGTPAGPVGTPAAAGGAVTGRRRPSRCTPTGRWGGTRARPGCARCRRCLPTGRRVCGPPAPPRPAHG